MYLEEKSSTLRDKILCATGTTFGKQNANAFPDFTITATVRKRIPSAWLQSDEQMGYAVGPHAIDTPSIPSSQMRRKNATAA